MILQDDPDWTSPDGDDDGDGTKNSEVSVLSRGRAHSANRPDPAAHAARQRCFATIEPGVHAAAPPPTPCDRTTIGSTRTVIPTRTAPRTRTTPIRAAAALAAARAAAAAAAAASRAPTPTSILRATTTTMERSTRHVGNSPRSKRSAALVHWPEDCQHAPLRR